MKLQYALFDFDGVVADSEPHVFAYLERALVPYGITLTPEDHRALIGSDGRCYIGGLLERHGAGVDVETFMTEKQKLGNYYEDSPLLAPMTGLCDFLDHLHSRGVITGLVSSTSTRLLVSALNRMRLTGRFAVVVGGDMVARRKPDPAGYQKAMALLGAQPSQTAAIEDSPTGICAARAAGLFVIGFKGSSIVQDTGAAAYETGNFASCIQLPWG